MSPVRLIILAVALVAGIGCVAVLAHGMASGRERAAPTVVAAPTIVEKPMTRVLVAKLDLPVGHRVAPEDMTWQEWPQDAVNPTFVTDGPAKPVLPMKAAGAAGKMVGEANKLADAAKTAMSNPADGPGANFVGAVVRQPILMNEPITDRKLVRAGASGVMAVTLDPGMRAMAVPLSAETAAGGFILPGDHVDIVQSHQLDASAASAGGAARRFGTETVLKNVRVLAIDQNTGAQKSASVVGATATVEVTPQQAELLVLAKAQGELTLVLRSYADVGGPAMPGTVAGAGSDSGSVVRVFRNGTPTAVTVNQ